MKSLWILFILGQIFSAGNMNHQQEAGFYEINPIYHIYGDMHPSKDQVYLTKAVEIAGVYGLTKLFPKHKKAILGTACGLTLGFIAYDNMMGIKMKVRW